MIEGPVTASRLRPVLRQYAFSQNSNGSHAPAKAAYAITGFLFLLITKESGLARPLFWVAGHTELPGFDFNFLYGYNET